MPFSNHNSHNTLEAHEYRFQAFKSSNSRAPVFRAAQGILKAATCKRGVDGGVFALECGFAAFKPADCTVFYGYRAKGRRTI